MILQNLFIFSFKRIRILAGIIAGIVLFWGISYGLRYIYVEENEWNRRIFNDLYFSNENIDCLYLGSSHVFSAVNTGILDSNNGKNNFNLATGSQSLIESYWLLKEASRNNSLSHVYVEMYYMCSTGIAGNYESSFSIKKTWAVTDYMKWSLNKVEALLDMNKDKAYYMDALVPWIRYRDKVFDIEWINACTTRKNDKEYKAFEQSETKLDECTGKEYETKYYPKGYYYSSRELSNLYMERNRDPNEMELTADSQKYLRKIIEYCQERDINITLFATPVYDCQLVSAENYDFFREQVSTIAEEYGIEFLDFNLIRPEYMITDKCELYRDMNHLNSRGAEYFTVLFNEVITSSEEEIGEYFYSSYEEKLSNACPQVYGIYSVSVNDNKTMYIAANRDSDLEYSIIIKSEEGEVILQDFSTSKIFSLPKNWTGLCTVTWREEEGRDEHVLQVRL